MGENKKPHIPAWKMWILVLSTTQAISAVQSFWVHQQMWEAIYHSRNTQNQVLQNDVEYHQNMNRALELILRKFQEH